VVLSRQSDELIKAAAGLGNLVSDVVRLGRQNMIEELAKKAGFRSPNLTHSQMGLKTVKMLMILANLTHSQMGLKTVKMLMILASDLLPKQLECNTHTNHQKVTNQPTNKHRSPPTATNSLRWMPPSLFVSTAENIA
jgi:hypothetical protein